MTWFFQLKSEKRFLVGTRHGHYCSDLWIDKTRYPEVTRGKRPLNKSQMARERTAAQSKLYLRVHWNH